jgi:3-deoxy-D-arabino-heptulosonate 7-phosphate (DAHP) synthase
LFINTIQNYYAEAGTLNESRRSDRVASKIVEVGYGNVKHVRIGGGGKLVLIGGPCAIENRDHALMMAKKMLLSVMT